MVRFLECRPQGEHLVYSVGDDLWVLNAADGSVAHQHHEDGGIAAQLLRTEPTALYFVPELQAFRASASSTVTAAEWYARGQRWQHLSWIRGTFMYAAFVPLLLAWRREVH